MASFSTHFDGGHEDWMQPANGLWEPEEDIDHSSFFIDALRMQASSGRISAARDSLVLSIPTSAAPRGLVALEQIQELGINISRERNIDTEPQYLLGSAANPNTEDQASDDTIQDEDTREYWPAYVTSPEAPHPPRRSGREPGLSLAEWTARKDEIWYWYIEKNYTCEMTMEQMAKQGFHATMPMYKRKFDKWKWKKYGAQPLTRRAGRGPCTTPDPSPGTIQDASTSSRSSPGRTVEVFAPKCVNSRIQTAMSNTTIMGLQDAMLFNAKELYLSYLSLQKWKVTLECEVEEDIHDDLLVGVATSLRNFKSLGHSGLEVGFKGMKQAFQILEKVVGVQKGADCGLFSLPAIWESFLRMLQNQSPDLASSFLSQAVQLAMQKFGKYHPFAQVLLILQKIQREDSQQLAAVIFTVYRSCIQHVENHLGSFHLTTLSLWGDFVVYLDGSSINQTRAAVDNIRRGIRESEEKNGSDHAYTLELLGLTLYVLQSDPTMAGEAEEVALDMFQRVERIKFKAGGQLEEDLLIMRKDLKHTLGTLMRNKKDYEMAVEYLEEFSHKEAVDDRDTLAMQVLEECYTSLGQPGKAEIVRKRRMEISRILLWQHGVKAPEDYKVCSIVEDPVESSDGQYNESTVVGDSENFNDEEDQDEENEEKDYDSTDETGDEAKKQLLREQIREREQRLEALEKKGKKRKQEKESSVVA